MTQLSIDQVSMQLPALIGQLGPGDEIVVTDGGKPVARVTAVGSTESKLKRRRGTAKGVLTIISEDDGHLDDFAEYM